MLWKIFFKSQHKDNFSITSGMQQVEPTGAEPDNNGLYHIDDMILDGYEFQEMYGNGKSGNPNKRFRWPKGEVPYE